MDLLPSEIARLVLGYLSETNCPSTWSEYLAESPDLEEVRQMYDRGRQCSTRVLGYTLQQILSEYCQAQALVDEAMVTRTALREAPRGFLEKLWQLAASTNISCQLQQAPEPRGAAKFGTPRQRTITLRSRRRWNGRLQGLEANVRLPDAVGVGGAPLPVPPSVPHPATTATHQLTTRGQTRPAEGLVPGQGPPAEAEDDPPEPLLSEEYPPPEDGQHGSDSALPPGDGGATAAGAVPRNIPERRGRRKPASIIKRRPPAEGGGGTDKLAREPDCATEQKADSVEAVTSFLDELLANSDLQNRIADNINRGVGGAEASLDEATIKSVVDETTADPFFSQMLRSGKPGGQADEGYRDAEEELVPVPRERRVTFADELSSPLPELPPATVASQLRQLQERPPPLQRHHQQPSFPQQPPRPMSEIQHHQLPPPQQPYHAEPVLSHHLPPPVPLAPHHHHHSHVQHEAIHHTGTQAYAFQPQPYPQLAPTEVPSHPPAQPQYVDTGVTVSVTRINENEVEVHDVSVPSQLRPSLVLPTAWDPNNPPPIGSAPWASPPKPEQPASAETEKKKKEPPPPEVVRFGRMLGEVGGVSLLELTSFGEKSEKPPLGAVTKAPKGAIPPWRKAKLSDSTKSTKAADPASSTNKEDNSSADKPTPAANDLSSSGGDIQADTGVAENEEPVDDPAPEDAPGDDGVAPSPEKTASCEDIPTAQSPVAPSSPATAESAVKPGPSSSPIRSMPLAAGMVCSPSPVKTSESSTVAAACKTAAPSNADSSAADGKADTGAAAAAGTDAAAVATVRSPPHAISPRLASLLRLSAEQQAARRGQAAAPSTQPRGRTSPPRCGRRQSASTPRRRSHVRALDFSTPPRASPLDARHLKAIRRRLRGASSSVSPPGKSPPGQRRLSPGKKRSPMRSVAVRTARRVIPVSAPRRLTTTRLPACGESGDPPSAFHMDVDLVTPCKDGDGNNSVRVTDWPSIKTPDLRRQSKRPAAQSGESCVGCPSTPGAATPGTPCTPRTPATPPSLGQPSAAEAPSRRQLGMDIERQLSRQFPSPTAPGAGASLYPVLEHASTAAKRKTPSGDAVATDKSASEAAMSTVDEIIDMVVSLPPEDDQSQELVMAIPAPVQKRKRRRRSKASPKLKPPSAPSKTHDTAELYPISPMVTRAAARRQQREVYLKRQERMRHGCSRGKATDPDADDVEQPISNGTAGDKDVNNITAEEGAEPVAVVRPDCFVGDLPGKTQSSTEEFTRILEKGASAASEGAISPSCTKSPQRRRTPRKGTPRKLQPLPVASDTALSPGGAAARCDGLAVLQAATAQDVTSLVNSDAPRTSLSDPTTAQDVTSLLDSDAPRTSPSDPTTAQDVTSLVNSDAPRTSPSDPTTAQDVTSPVHSDAPRTSLSDPTTAQDVTSPVDSDAPRTSLSDPTTAQDVTSPVDSDAPRTSLSDPTTALACSGLLELSCSRKSEAAAPEAAAGGSEDGNDGRSRRHSGSSTGSEDSSSSASSSSSSASSSSSSSSGESEAGEEPLKRAESLPLAAQALLSPTAEECEEGAERKPRQRKMKSPVKSPIDSRENYSQEISQVSVLSDRSRPGRRIPLVPVSTSQSSTANAILTTSKIMLTVNRKDKPAANSCAKTKVRLNRLSSHSPDNMKTPQNRYARPACSTSEAAPPNKLAAEDDEVVRARITVSTLGSSPSVISRESRPRLTQPAADPPMSPRGPLERTTDHHALSVEPMEASTTPMPSPTPSLVLETSPELKPGSHPDIHSDGESVSPESGRPPPPAHARKTLLQAGPCLSPGGATQDLMMSDDDSVVDALQSIHESPGRPLITNVAGPGTARRRITLGGRSNSTAQPSGSGGAANGLPRPQSPPTSQKARGEAKNAGGSVTKQRDFTAALGSKPTLHVTASAPNQVKEAASAKRKTSAQKTSGMTQGSESQVKRSDPAKAVKQALDSGPVAGRGAVSEQPPRQKARRKAEESGGSAAGSASKVALRAVEADGESVTSGRTKASSSSMENVPTAEGVGGSSGREVSVRTTPGKTTSPVIASSTSVPTVTETIASNVVPRTRVGVPETLRVERVTCSVSSSLVPKSSSSVATSTICRKTNGALSTARSNVSPETESPLVSSRVHVNNRSTTHQPAPSLHTKPVCVDAAAVRPPLPAPAALRDGSDSNSDSDSDGISVEEALLRCAVSPFFSLLELEPRGQWQQASSRAAFIDRLGERCAEVRSRDQLSFSGVLSSAQGDPSPRKLTDLMDNALGVGNASPAQGGAGRSVPVSADSPTGAVTQVEGQQGARRIVYTGVQTPPAAEAGGRTRPVPPAVKQTPATGRVASVGGCDVFSGGGASGTESQATRPPAATSQTTTPAQPRHVPTRTPSAPSAAGRTPVPSGISVAPSMSNPAGRGPPAPVPAGPSSSSRASNSAAAKPSGATSSGTVDPAAACEPELLTSPLRRARSIDGTLHQGGTFEIAQSPTKQVMLVDHSSSPNRATAPRPPTGDVGRGEAGAVQRQVGTGVSRTPAQSTGELRRSSGGTDSGGQVDKHRPRNEDGREEKTHEKSKRHHQKSPHNDKERRESGTHSSHRIKSPQKHRKSSEKHRSSGDGKKHISKSVEKVVTDPSNPKSGTSNGDVISGAKPAHSDNSDSKKTKRGHSMITWSTSPEVNKKHRQEDLSRRRPGIRDRLGARAGGSSSVPQWSFAELRRKRREEEKDRHRTNDAVSDKSKMEGDGRSGGQKRQREDVTAPASSGEFLETPPTEDTPGEPGIVQNRAKSGSGGNVLVERLVLGSAGLYSPSPTGSARPSAASGKESTSTNRAGSKPTAGESAGSRNHQHRARPTSPQSAAKRRRSSGPGNVKNLLRGVNLGSFVSTLHDNS